MLRNNIFGDFLTKLSSDYLILLILQVSGLLIPLFLTPHLFKVLPSEVFGEVMFLMTLMQLLSLIVDYGYSLYGTPIVVTKKNSLIELSRFFSDSFFGRLLILGLVYIVYLTVTFYVSLNQEMLLVYQLFFFL